jgi:hypothetical protein
MSDVYHWIGGDLSLSATGDLQAVDSTTMGQQRVLRRLLSNSANLAREMSADYIWHQDYGASLPREVGLLTDASRIKAEIRGHIFKESAVSRTPEPEITVMPIPNGVAVKVRYVDAVSKDWIPLAFDINR